MKNKYFNHDGDSNPNSGPTRRKDKLGIVPRPRGNYEQALTEHDAKQQGKQFGERTVKHADMPQVQDRQHADASSGTEQFSKDKPALHGHVSGVPSRGRAYEYSQVETAKEREPGYVKKCRDTQLGSNGVGGSN
jgi:hypothetical protein